MHTGSSSSSSSSTLLSKVVKINLKYLVTIEVINSLKNLSQVVRDLYMNSVCVLCNNNRMEFSSC